MASLAQVLLKVGAVKCQPKVLIASFFNIFTASGLSLMVLSTIPTFYALQEVPLRDMAYILPGAFVLVPVFSFIFLRERMLPQQIAGTCIIVVGIGVFNL